MKKKYLVYAAMPVLALTLLAASTASAHGMFGLFGANATPQEIASRQTTMFQQEANLLGVSVDEVKATWAQGKTLFDLAKEKGITDSELQAKMKEARLARVKTELQSLVDQGVITQAQADQRYAWMSTSAQAGKLGSPRFGGEAGKGFGGRGMRHGMMGVGF